MAKEVPIGIRGTQSIVRGYVFLLNKDGTLKRKVAVTKQQLDDLNNKMVMPPGVDPSEWGPGISYATGNVLNAGEFLERENGDVVAFYGDRVDVKGPIEVTVTYQTKDITSKLASTLVVADTVVLPPEVVAVAVAVDPVIP